MSCVVHCLSRADQRSLCVKLRMYAKPRRSPITGKMTRPKPLLFYGKDPENHVPGSSHEHHKIVGESTHVVGEVCQCNRKRCYSLSVPMAWYMASAKKSVCNTEYQLESPCSRMKAVRPLFEHQIEVFDEVLRKMRRRRTAVLALHTGFGKCFARDTPFLISDGSTKFAQDLEVGDELVGATDGLARVITGTCRGRSEMFTVHQEWGMDYTVNAGHILSLAVIENNYTVADCGTDGSGLWSRSRVRWFDAGLSVHTTIMDSIDMQTHIDRIKLEGEARYVDVEIERYLELPAFVKTKLAGYHSAHRRRYPRETEERAARRYAAPARVSEEIEFRGTAFGGRDPRMCVGSIVRVCRRAGVYARFCVDGLLCGMEPKDGYVAEAIDVRKLPDNAEYFGFHVSPLSPRVRDAAGGARILLSDHTVVHNTTLACSLIPKVGYRTAIILPRGVLFEQWQQTLEATLHPPPLVQILRKGKDEVDPNAEIILMSPGIACKKTVRDFAGIGFLLCDEAHMLCSPSHSKLFMLFRPRVLLCLTATPERPDGMENVLHAVAGAEKHFIRRKMSIPHRVWRIKTGCYPPDPEELLNEQGKLDWNSVLKWQCCNPGRNGDIAELCDSLVQEGRTVLVLCKRIMQVQEVLCLINELRGEGGYITDSFTGSAKTFDRDCKVLVSSYSKSGVGFDLPTLDTLIVASDVEAMIQQYHGRIFRRVGVDALVIDLLDDLSSMQRHCRTRMKYYEEAGGVKIDVSLQSAIEGLRTEGIFARCFGLCPVRGCLASTPDGVLCGGHRRGLMSALDEVLWDSVPVRAVRNLISSML